MHHNRPFHQPHDGARRYSGDETIRLFHLSSDNVKGSEQHERRSAKQPLPVVSQPRTEANTNANANATDSSLFMFNVLIFKIQSQWLALLVQHLRAGAPSSHFPAPSPAPIPLLLQLPGTGHVVFLAYLLLTIFRSCSWERGM